MDLFQGVLTKWLLLTIDILEEILTTIGDVYRCSSTDSSNFRHLIWQHRHGG